MICKTCENKRHDLACFNCDEGSHYKPVGNVAKPDACHQLYDVRALGEAICDMEKYISDESSMLGETYKKVVEKYNKVSKHFI